MTGNQVRLEAGDTPGTMDVTYSVIDSAGNRASSTVTFEILAASDHNQEPRPHDIIRVGHGRSDHPHPGLA